MKRITRLLAATTLSMLCAAALAQDNAGSVRATATVQGVDQATRTVTLKDQRGEIISFVASDAVRKLGEIRVGDVVTLENAEAVATKLAKTVSTTPQRTVKVGMERSPAGEMPAGTITREFAVVASVEAIDTRRSRVTLRDSEQEVSMKVQDPAMLQYVKVGDMVEARYVEVVTMKVERGEKR